MAYGVKFRLEFTDDNLKDKKVEILKDGYVKAQPSDPDLTIYSLVATENPIEITWDQDDDFYNPIIGSHCDLNLFVTDDTSYDDFYTFDEREYKVRVSYKDSSDVYQIYWEGWLLVDQFKEGVISTPYPIKLSAYDGLGSLNGFTAPIDLTSVSSKDLMYYIHNILGNLDLGFDIYVSNDIQKHGALSTDYTIYDQTTVTPDSLLKDNVQLRDAKNVLEQILRFTNARIFQSYGRWYIINNSSYSEQSVKDSSATTANGGSIPTGIRASETSSLQDNATEEIKYFIYNSSGVYQSESEVDVLQVLAGPSTTLTKTNCVSNCNIPVDLVSLNESLTKEYIRPLKEYILEVNTNDGFFDTDRVINGGFEHGSTRWTLTNSTIDTTFSFKGDRSVKTTSVVTSSSSTTVVLQNSTAIDVSANSERADTLTINNYFDSTSGNNRGFRWQLKIVEIGPGATATKYWNSSTSAWSDTSTINEQEVDTNRRWKNYKFNLDSYPQATTGSWEVTIYLYSAYQNTSTSGFVSMHYDSIQLEYKNLDGSARTDIFSKFDLLQFVRKRTADLSGTKLLGEFYLTNDKYARIIGDFYRSRDKTNYLKSIEKITTQQVINDFRDFVLRYEGELYNYNTDPISLHHKIWVNYGSSVLQEPVSCIIDGMSYNVKRNTYTTIMHVPNQDDDESSDFIIKF